MSDLVILRLGHGIEDAAAWAAFSGDELDQSGACKSVDDLIEVLQRFGDGARFAAVLPGEQVAMRVLASPPRNAAKFASAATLLLEDELAQPVDECHVAIQQAGDAGKAYAVDARIIRRWVAFFAEAGFPLSHLTVDFECLGGARERPVLFLEDGRIIASFGDRAFAAEKTVALAAIKALLGEIPQISVSVYGGPATSSALRSERYERLGPADDETLLRAAAAEIWTGAAVNLLQGDFRIRRRRAVDLSRWRRPAAAAAIFAVALLALAVSDGFRAKRMADRYAGEAQRLHQDRFPEAANADPRAHARAVLARGGGASFLALSGVLSRALADNDAVLIDRMRFDAARGRLTFTIRSASDASIEGFRQTLASLGVTTSETGGYRRSGAYWVGEMTASL